MSSKNKYGLYQRLFVTFLNAFMKQTQQKEQSIELSSMFENKSQNTFDYQFCSETKVIFF